MNVIHDYRALAFTRIHKVVLTWQDVDPIQFFKSVNYIESIWLVVGGGGVPPPSGTFKIMISLFPNSLHDLYKLVKNLR